MLRNKCFVLGLDGLPFKYLSYLFNKGYMKRLHKIVNTGMMREINSVHPPVSSVAWTSFSTGKPPADTNIFGFVDRSENSLFIPTDVQRKAATIWEKLSAREKRSIVINVPISYPVSNINGIMVSSFLCPREDKSTYPHNYYHYLQQKGYKLDVDATLAIRDKPELMRQIISVMKARFEVTMELLREQDLLQELLVVIENI